MGQFITMKRWRLREERQEAELVELVEGAIVPHYQQLSDAVRLGLWRIDGTRSYLALQYWRSRADWASVRQSEAFQDWFHKYEPILERWDEFMEFEDEWEAEELLSGSFSH
jgi:hypothetical protein